MGRKVWAQNTFIDFLADLDSFQEINFLFFQFFFDLPRKKVEDHGGYMKIMAVI